MKRITLFKLFPFLIFTLPVQLFGQNVKNFGIYQEVNLVMTGKDYMYESQIATGGLGLYGSFVLSDRLAIIPNLGYLRKGLNVESEIRDANYNQIGLSDVKYRTDMLNLGLCMGYYVNHFISVRIGASLNYNLSTDVSWNPFILSSNNGISYPYDILIVEEDFQELEANGIIGLAFDFGYRMNAFLNFNYAFNSLIYPGGNALEFNRPNPLVRFNTIQLRLAYAFNDKKGVDAK